MTSSRGIRNNNPLNIRKGCSWMGERGQQDDSQFEQFVSMEMGLRAGIRLVCNHIDGRTSSKIKCSNLDRLIRAWAPPTENNAEAYIATVEKLTGINRFQRIYSNNRDMICRIVRAMAQVECGSSISAAIVRSAWDLL